MGAICSCGRYSQHYVDDWSEEDVIQSVTPFVESSPNKIVYKGSGSAGSAGENRSLEKLVEAGLIEADTYLMFKNTTIRELGIVRTGNEGGDKGVSIEFEGEHMSLAKFCKKGAAKHGKTWNGTPWNSVYTINEDDEPLDRIDVLWNRMKKEGGEGTCVKEE